MDFKDSCRLCLVKEHVELEIFSASNAEHVLAKITSCLPNITISKDDNLPKSICTTCANKLNDFNEFQNNCMAVECQLLEWAAKASSATHSASEKPQCSNIKQEAELFEYNCDLPSMDNENESSGDDNELEYSIATRRPRRASAMKRNYSESNGTATVTKKESDDSFDDDDNSADFYVPPVASTKKKIRVKTETPASSKKSKSALTERRNGKKSERKERSKQVKATDIKVESNQTKCNNHSMTKSPETRDAYTNDDDGEQEESVYCEECNLICKDTVALALHSKQHSNDNKYTCPVCHFATTSKYGIESHTKVHDGTTKFKCEVCHKGFTDSTRASEHKYLHSGEKPFQCEICGCKFTFSWSLRYHRRTQHWEALTGTPLVKYDCTICKKHYNSSTGLRLHKLKQHSLITADRSLLCDVCGKSLSTKEKLKFHSRIHTGYKPFSCGTCLKGFSRKENLKQHERTHTGEKPYICQYCGKGFTQRSPLLIHLRIHTGERPYVCRVCGKGFVSKGTMDTHMRTCS